MDLDFDLDWNEVAYALIIWAIFMAAIWLAPSWWGTEYPLWIRLISTPTLLIISWLVVHIMNNR